LKTVAVIRKAMPDDLDSIFDIIKQYSDTGIILERSLRDVKASLNNFYVAEINHTLAGVCSFYDYGGHLKEIRSLGVKKKFLRKGIGSALVKLVVQDLCAFNNPRIFVLTYTPEFFERNGFSIISKSTLPEKIWKDCITCRNIDSCHETALEFYCRSEQDVSFAL
jgi:amino-acid N-acetyltransferase